MELSPKSIATILEALSEPEHKRSFLALLEGEAGKQWQLGQNKPHDTSADTLRLEQVAWLDQLLDELSKDPVAGGQGLSPAVKAADFYHHSGAGVDPKELAGGLTTPLAAFKIFRTVFAYDYDDGRWSARPWLGSERRSAASDPLLALPYQRKYDWERAAAAERRETLLWERLCRAADLVGVIIERVQRVEIPRHLDAGRFDLPDFDDVQAELKRDELALADDTLGLERKLGFALVPLDLFDVGADGRPRLSWPALASGCYEGPLLEDLAPSQASAKESLARALENLRESLWELIHPLEDEERQELDDESSRLRASFSEAEARRHPRSRPSSLAGGR